MLIASKLQDILIHMRLRVVLRGELGVEKVLVGVTSRRKARWWPSYGVNWIENSAVGYVTNRYRECARGITDSGMV